MSLFHSLVRYFSISHIRGHNNLGTVKSECQGKERVVLCLHCETSFRILLNLRSRILAPILRIGHLRLTEGDN